jgi:hypothetical protein
MKKLLIGLLALGSISSFAQSATLNNITCLIVKNGVEVDSLMVGNTSSTSSVMEASKAILTAEERNNHATLEYPQYGIHMKGSMGIGGLFKSFHVEITKMKHTSDYFSQDIVTEYDVMLAGNLEMSTEVGIKLNCIIK